MSGRSTPRGPSPRGSRTPRGPLRNAKQLNSQPSAVVKPFHNSSANEAEVQQDEEEAAQAALLLQEALRGTPRHRPDDSQVARHAPIVVPTPPKQGQVDVDDDEDAEHPPLIPEQLMARRRLRDNPEAQWMYLVRFRGLGREDDYWVPESDLDPAFVAAELAAAEADRQEAIE